jgi:DNA-binding response OmpR family regulator
MSENSSDLPHELIAADLAEFLETAAEQSWPVGAEELDGPKSFRFALGQQPIQLGNIEFRILLFLASRPYHAFSRRAVAEAVSTDLAPVSEVDIDETIGTLRDQLGVFYDYVQTVPYVGYRFKA